MSVFQKAFLISVISFFSIPLYCQDYARDLPRVEPTGAYQLFTLLRHEIPDTPTYNAVLDTLDKYLEVQYKYGANGDRLGIDCSALTLNVFRDIAKKKIPRTAAGQFLEGRSIHSKDMLRFGDLVFFKINSKRISHVGIYIASGHFVHASSSLGVTVNNLDEAYYKRHYVGAKRIVDNFD